MNTYGPTLTSFQIKYGTDGPTISKVFPIMTGSYLLGGLSATFIYSRVNRQLAVVFILGILSATIFMIPLCPTMALYFIAAGVVGMCAGLYDTAQLTWIPEMMQKECPPFVQGQHFFYALGTNLAALLMAPFLMENEPSQLFIPYAVNGTLISMAMLSQVSLFTFLRYHPPPPEMLIEETEVHLDTDELTQLTGSSTRWFPLNMKLTILSCCFFGAYLGMESSIFQFFSKFAQNSDLHLTQSQAAYALTGLTAAFAAGRGLGIITVLKVSPQLILCGNIVLVSIANMLLIGWSGGSLPVLWTSGIIFGLGLSCTLASFTAFIERHLKFTNFMGSLITVSGSGVGAIYQLILGAFIDSHPIVLSYTTFFSLSVILASITALSYLTYKNVNRQAM